MTMNEASAAKHLSPELKGEEITELSKRSIHVCYMLPTVFSENETCGHFKSLQISADNEQIFYVSAHKKKQKILQITEHCTSYTSLGSNLRVRLRRDTCPLDLPGGSFKYCRGILDFGGLKVK